MDVHMGDEGPVSWDREKSSPITNYQHNISVYPSVSLELATKIPCPVLTIMPKPRFCIRKAEASTLEKNNYT